MDCSIKINTLAAEIRNGECVIKKFDPYATRNQDYHKLKLAYLEQAKYCIDEYYSVIQSGRLDEKSLYSASRFLAKAVYAVRQAKSASYYEGKETK